MISFALIFNLSNYVEGEKTSVVYLSLVDVTLKFVNLDCVNSLFYISILTGIKGLCIWWSVYIFAEEVLFIDLVLESKCI